MSEPVSMWPEFSDVYDGYWVDITMEDEDLEELPVSSPMDAPE